MANLFNRMIDDKTGEEYIVKDAKARESIQANYTELSENINATIDVAGSNAVSIDMNSDSIITEADAITINAGSNTSEAESIEMICEAIQTLAESANNMAVWMTGINATTANCVTAVDDLTDQIEQIAGEIPAGMVHMSYWKASTTPIEIDEIDEIDG